MQITIDTNNLSELDIAMLAFLAGQEVDEEEVDETPAPAPAAKKAAPAKKAAAPKAEAKAKEPEPEAEEELIEAEPEAEEGAPSMSDAVAAATALVSAGESAKVKAALAEVGAKRVSEMSEDDIPAFLAALDA